MASFVLALHDITFNINNIHLNTSYCLSTTWYAHYCNYWQRKQQDLQRIVELYKKVSIWLKELKPTFKTTSDLKTCFHLAQRLQTHSMLNVLFSFFSFFFNAREWLWSPACFCMMYEVTLMLESNQRAGKNAVGPKTQIIDDEVAWCRTMQSRLLRFFFSYLLMNYALHFFLFIVSFTTVERPEKKHVIPSPASIYSLLK